MVYHVVRSPHIRQLGSSAIHVSKWHACYWKCVL